jgi:hypothetical protein
MRTKRTLTMAAIMITLVSIAAFAIIKSTQPVEAQDTQPARSERHSFGMVGITSGQTMRINVANILAAGDSIFPPGPTRVAIIVINSRGQVARNHRGEPIRRVVQLERGDSTFLDVDFEDLPPGPVRQQFRAVVNALPPGPSSEQLPPSPIMPTVEVFNSSTGRTLFMHPAVIRGFNPQPDPPLE